MTSNSIVVVSVAAVVIAGCGGTAGNPSDTTPLASQSSELSRLGGAQDAVLPRLSTTPTETDPTVPANGDVNPYGVAFVPPDFPSGGVLSGGDIIVANFNNSANLQGTGTTIVRVNRNASPTLFFSDEAAAGFSTALGALGRGFVLVGNLPSTDGSGACTPGPNGEEQNVGQGSLLVIDRRGRLVQTLTDATFLDGPWDLTLEDEGGHAVVFVANALSGTVTRLDLDVGDDAVIVRGQTQIASGYTHRCDPAAFVVGPTGLALDRDRDRLYVASAGDNAIFAIDDPNRRTRDEGRGRTIVSDAVHLHGPLGLARAPNGDLLSAQGDAVNPDPNQPSEIVEFSADGAFVAERSVDSAAGSAFGLAIKRVGGDGFRFAAVDDGQNVLDVWSVK